MGAHVLFNAESIGWYLFPNPTIQSKKLYAFGEVALVRIKNNAW